MRGIRMLRWAGIALVVGTVALVLAAWGASRSSWGREEVRQLIERQAAAVLDGTLTIHELSGSLLSGVTASGVRFVHADREVFTAASAEIRFSAWGWLRGARVISLVRVVDPVIRVTEQHQNWDVATWVRPSKSTGRPSVPVLLRSVEIVNGRLLATANENVWRLPADVTALNGLFAMRTGGGFRMDIQRLSFAVASGGPAFHARNATGALTFASDVHLERVRVESDAGALTADGRIGPPGPRTLALQATFERFDTAKWRRFTPLLDTIDLVADGTAAFGGNMDRLTVRTALKTSAGAITGDTVIASLPHGARITGTAQTTNFNAQHVTGDPVWASALTGRGQYTVVSNGSPAQWTSDITMTGGPVRAFGADIERLDGTMHYAAKVVTFATTATAYGASGHVAGTVHVASELTIDATGDSLMHLDPRKLPPEWEYLPLDADLNASAFTVHWTPSQWATTATLETSTVEGATMVAGTTVEVSGAKDVIRIAADGNVRTLDARRMGRATGLTGLDDPIFVTDIDGHVKVSGQGRNLTEIDLVAAAELQHSKVAVGATTPAATIAYTRTSHLNTAHVVGEIVNLNPATVGASEALASQINGHMDFTAVWRDDVADIPGTMTARGTLKATASVISDLPIDRGVVTGEWRDGAFTATSATLQNSGVTFTGRGRVAITRGVSDATFEVNATDVAPLEPWTGRKAHGKATGQGRLTGAFDAPRIRAEFASPRLSDPALGVFSVIAGDIDAVFPEWYLDRMRGDVHTRAASWAADETAAPTAEALTAHGAFTTRMIVSAAEVQATMNKTVIRAAMSADWTKAISADIRSLEATRGAQTWRLDPTSGRLQVTDTHVNATNVQFINGAQHVTLAGSVALAGVETGGDANDQLSARATAMDLGALEEFLGLDTGARGLATAELTLIGRVSDPRGSLTLAARDLTVRGFKLATVGGTIDFANGAAMSSLMLTQPDGVAMTVVGRVPLAYVLPAGMLDAAVPSPTWDVSVASDPINLGVLVAASSALSDLAGQAIVDLHIVGNAAEPNVTGTLAIADGRFGIPSLGSGFSKVTADIGIGLETVTVRRFVATDKHGHLLKITGQLAMNEGQLKGVDVNLEADRVSFVDNAVGNIELSSLLQLSGTFDHPRLSGNIEVASGRVEVDRLLRMLQGDPLAFVAETDLPAAGVTLVDLRADAAAAAKAAEDAAAKKATGAAFDSRSFLSSLAVDVQILAPDNLILRGSALRPGGKNTWSLGDLNVTVGGDLQATRAPGELARMRGDVTMVRGSYSFENRRFEIQRGGRIRFQGALPPDPVLDVRGVRIIQGVEARVDVRGTLSAPRLELGSNVPLDESDILSMIVFNRPVNQLGDTQRADLVGVAAVMAGGMVSSPLTQRLSRALDLDLLEVETVSFGQNVAPRVRIGQQLTNRLFVQLSQQFGTQSLTELTAEFQLKKYLRLQGSTAQGPGSTAQRSLMQRVERLGLDLLFFFNY